MKTLLIVTSILFIAVNSCFALDIDDSISADDDIDEYHEMGKMQKNISYVVLNAISKAYTSASDDDVIVDDTYGTSKNLSVNSVIVGAGSNVRGDIIIIDQSQGDKAAIATK